MRSNRISVESFATRAVPQLWEICFGYRDHQHRHRFRHFGTSNASSLANTDDNNQQNSAYSSVLAWRMVSPKIPSS